MTAIFSSVMDLVYENSVSAIENLQAKYLDKSDMFFMISNMFDPRYAFLVYSPLIFSLDWAVGKKIMWVSVVSEWLNQMLKWLLHGERPYWWIRETQVYNRTGTNTPDIQQFFMTCETGPGSPSGHAMATAAVWYVILDSYLRKFSFVKKDSNNIISKVCWLAYLVLLAVVSASRVFIAAHFPHQCMLGIAVGCLVALAFDNINEKKLNTFSYCAITAGLLGSAFSMYGLLIAIGVNPMWSVDRAIKWCAKPEYVHLDTSPFYSMMRYSGFMFGMGFGLNSNDFKRISKEKVAMGMRITCAVLSVTICKLSEKINFPRDNMTIFYILTFFTSASLAYMMISVVPNIMSKIWHVDQKSKNK